MIDLYNNKYDRNALKENIYAVKLIDILKTQTLDIYFIVRYILSDLYQIHDDDKKIDVETILNNQPHIKRDELLLALIDYNSDDDSIEDFDSFSDRNC